MEIFCRHDIDLENDNGHVFEDLIEKVLVLIETA